MRSVRLQEENIIAKWEKSFGDLSVEYKAPKPEKIIVFLFPDKRSSERIMFYSGDRLLYHNTIILTDGQNHVPESKRIKAFMQGFLTGSEREGDKQAKQ